MLENPIERMIVTNQIIQSPTESIIGIPHASVLLIKSLFPEINFAWVQIGKYQQDEAHEEKSENEVNEKLIYLQRFIE